MITSLVTGWSCTWQSEKDTIHYLTSEASAAIATSNKQEPFLMARDLKEYIKASERAKHSSMIASYTPDNNAICE